MNEIHSERVKEGAVLPCHAKNSGGGTLPNDSSIFLQHVTELKIA